MLALLSDERCLMLSMTLNILFNHILTTYQHILINIMTILTTFLLGQNWTHAILCVVSSLFHVLHFTHEGKIVIVDQLTFFSSNSSNGNVSYLENTDIPYENVRAGLFKDSSLMGNFFIPPPNITSINMISTSHNPRIIPHPYQADSLGDIMPLSQGEQAYQAIFLASMVTYESHVTLIMHLDMYSQSLWLGSWHFLDPLNETFPTDKSITEVMSLEEIP